MVTPEILMGLSLLFLLPVVRLERLIRPARLRPRHVLYQLRRDRRPGQGGRDEPAAGGGRPGRDPGLVRARAFRFVTLPLILPAVISALLAFALSFDDYVVTTFNAGVGSSTLPLYIYGKVKFGVTPEINAISTIIVAVTAVLVLVAWRFSRGRGGDQAVAEPEPERAVPAPAVREPAAPTP